MKTFFPLWVSLLLLAACKKGQVVSKSAEPSPQFMQKIHYYFSKTLQPDLFEKINWDGIQVVETPRHTYVLASLRALDPQRHFLLLDSPRDQSDIRGLRIDLENAGSSLVDGFLQALDLNTQKAYASTLQGGYLTTLHSAAHEGIDVNNASQALSLPDPSQVLPEVIVVGYIPTGSAASVGYPYLLAPSLFDWTNGSTSGSGNASSGASSGASSWYLPQGPRSAPAGSAGTSALSIGYEYSFANPEIDLTEYLRCFGRIPDAGAQYSITLYVDLPVNDQPEYIFNWYTGATGHVFMQLSKSNGTAELSQVFGFGAQKPLQALLGASPIACKWIDNSGHKFNASLKISLGPAQWQTLITQLIFLSQNIQYYSIDQYNCVDFVLQAVNSVLGVQPLVLPKIAIPGRSFSGSNTPQGLYQLLSTLQESGGAFSSNILLGVILHAPTGNGPCP